MVLEIPVDQIIKMIGHDGHEMINPGLDEPECFRGFHVQELVDVCLALGFSCTEIEANPIWVRDNDLTPTPVFERQFDADDRFFQHVNNGQGIILGRGKNHGHAVAWDGKMIFDPNGTSYPLESAPDNNFNQLQSFLRIKSLPYNV